MVIPSAVAYGVLVSVGLVVLVAFLVIFMRLERAQKRIEEDRPPMPVGWPISTADATPSAPPGVRPGGLRDPEMFAPQSQKEPSQRPWINAVSAPGRRATVASKGVCL